MNTLQWPNTRILTLGNLAMHVMLVCNVCSMAIHVFEKSSDCVQVRKIIRKLNFHEISGSLNHLISIESFALHVQLGKVKILTQKHFYVCLW